jgi:hypothetical protein
LRAQLRIWPAINESKPHRIPFADQCDQRPKHRHSKPTGVGCQVLLLQARSIGYTSEGTSGKTFLKAIDLILLRPLVRSLPEKRNKFGQPIPIDPALLERVGRNMRDRSRVRRNALNNRAAKSNRAGRVI